MIVVRFITAMTKIKLLAALDERQIILFTLISSSPPFPNWFISLWYYHHPANWLQQNYLISGQCFFHISILLRPSVLSASHFPWVKGKETNLRNTTWVERTDLQIIQVRGKPWGVKKAVDSNSKVVPWVWCWRHLFLPEWGQSGSPRVLLVFVHYLLSLPMWEDPWVH